MFAITGISGRVGGAAARTLHAHGHSLRAVLRDRAKAAPWAARAAEIALADFADVDAVRAAFTGVEGVFVMIPPDFDPVPGYPETRAIIAAVREALEAAAPPKVVCLSSVGAQHRHGLGLIAQSALLERELGRLSIPLACVRAAWFMENAGADVATARTRGVIASHLSPLDRAIPMVATADIGAMVAELLTQRWTGTRIVELEGPRRYSPNGVAAVLGDLLHRPVRAELVPRDRWDASFRAAGHRHPEARIAMLDGFNSGWITFAKQGCEHRCGATSLDTALRPLIAESAHAA